MKKQILFLHGGAGQGDYVADAKLVDSLKASLSGEYTIHYPLLSEEDTPDFGRKKQIVDELSSMEEPIIIVGHSLGASMTLKYLSEEEILKKISAIFLIATPFWSGNEDWVQGLKLNTNFSDIIPKDIPLYLYHSKDDEIVSFDHLAIYADLLPHAQVREIESGGHQLDNDLSVVAKDILSL